MRVTHVTVEANTPTLVTLPVMTGEVLVKNLTSADLLVSLKEEDFAENYVKIPTMTAEVLCDSVTHATTKAYFFNKIYLKAVTRGEVEIRCLKL